MPLENYRNIARQYPKLPLRRERMLLARAKRGSKKSANEIVLSHISFVIFRLYKRAFHDFANRYGEDIVSESIPLLYRKIKTFDLGYRYRDNEGKPKPVKFCTYIWKGIDGFIIASLKREYARERRQVQFEDGVAVN